MRMMMLDVWKKLMVHFLCRYCQRRHGRWETVVLRAWVVVSVDPFSVGDCNDGGGDDGSEDFVG
jgi:hypothetical protein